VVDPQDHLMPTYTIQGNIRNQRAATAARLASFFAHAETINMVITGMAVTPQGAVTITTQNSIPADQLAHLEAT
jgi:hypothetical protein